MISVITKSTTFSFHFGLWWWVDTEVWLSRVSQVPWFYTLAKALFLLPFALEESCSPLKTGHREDPSQRKDPAISLGWQNRIPSVHTQSPCIVIHLLYHSKILPHCHRLSISSGLIICRQYAFLTMQKNHKIKDISLTHFHQKITHRDISGEMTNPSSGSM